MDNENTMLLGENAEASKNLDEKTNSKEQKKFKHGVGMAAGMAAGVAGVAGGLGAYAASNNDSDSIKDSIKSEENINDDEIQKEDSTNSNTHSSSHSSHSANPSATGSSSISTPSGENTDSDSTIQSEETNDSSVGNTETQNEKNQEVNDTNNESNVEPGIHKEQPVASEPRTIPHIEEPHGNQQGEPNFIQATLSEDPMEGDIKVLGVATVENEAGQNIDVAIVGNDNDAVLLVDINQDSIVDLMIHDDNNDGMIQISEMRDVSAENINLNDYIASHAPNVEPVDPLYSTDPTDPNDPIILTTEPVDDPIEEPSMNVNYEPEPYTFDENPSEEYLSNNMTDEILPDDLPDYYNDADFTIDA